MADSQEVFKLHMMNYDKFVKDNFLHFYETSTFLVFQPGLNKKWFMAIFAACRQICRKFIGKKAFGEIHTSNLLMNQSLML